MDLRNNQITLGELWDNPRSRAVFQRKVPMLAKHPVKGAAARLHWNNWQTFWTVGSRLS